MEVGEVLADGQLQRGRAADRHRAVLDEPQIRHRLHLHRRQLRQSMQGVYKKAMDSGTRIFQFNQPVEL